MKTAKIKLLIDRFLDGETTLAEEQQLYDYFRRRRVAREMLPYRQMFIDMGVLRPKAKTIVMRPYMRWMVAIAASLLLIFGIQVVRKTYTRNQLLARYEGSYVIVDGQRTDNLLKIHTEIERTLADARHIESRLQGENVIDRAEQEVLQSIDDAEQRKEIERLLNP